VETFVDEAARVAGAILEEATAVGDRSEAVPALCDAVRRHLGADGCAILPSSADVVRGGPAQDSGQALPLVLGGVVVGVLAVWWAPDEAPPPMAQVVLDLVAPTAALLVEPRKRHERWFEVAAALSSSMSLTEVLEVVCDAFEQLLDTVHCSVNLHTYGKAGPYSFTTLAVRGVRWFAGRIDSLTGIDSHEVTRVDGFWSSVVAPVVYTDVDAQAFVPRHLIPSAIESVILFPLRHDDGVRGAIVIGLRRKGGVSEDDLRAGQALANLAATAIRRAELAESARRRLCEVQALYHLADVITGAADLTTGLELLNDILAEDAQVTVERFVVSNARVRAVIGGGADAPDASEAAAIRTWRADLRDRDAVTPEPVAVPGGLLVPVVWGRTVYGALKVASNHERAAEPDLVAAIARGCADVIHRARERQLLADRDRELAIAAERERIARDLHDSVAQILVGMGLRLNHYLEDAPDEEWRNRLQQLLELARRGEREAREAIHALLFKRQDDERVATSIEHLVREFEASSGVPARLSVVEDGRRKPLPCANSDALVRAAREALANVAKHASAAHVSLRLHYAPDRVTLVVEDDGVGLDHAATGAGANGKARGGRNGHDAARQRSLGLVGLERMLVRVGGGLEVSSREPAGVAVEAWVPSNPTANGSARSEGSRAGAQGRRR
jgi:signal transduction histidine kinase